MFFSFGLWQSNDAVLHIYHTIQICVYMYILYIHIALATHIFNTYVQMSTSHCQHNNPFPWCFFFPPFLGYWVQRRWFWGAAADHWQLVPEFEHLGKARLCTSHSDLQKEPTIVSMEFCQDLATLQMGVWPALNEYWSHKTGIISTYKYHQLYASFSAPNISHNHLILSCLATKCSRSTITCMSCGE